MYHLNQKSIGCLIGRHDWIGGRNEMVKYGTVRPGEPVEVIERRVDDQGSWCRCCGKIKRHGSMTARFAEAPSERG